MRQSSADEAARRGGGATKRRVAGGGDADNREQWYLLYSGLAGTALVTTGLWLLRGWIARASGIELLAGVMLVIGAGVVVTVIAGFFFFATRVDRASEDVSRALDEIARGVLPPPLYAPKGLGREARLAGAASAALTRLAAWLDQSRSGVASVEQELSALRDTLPRIREALAGTTNHVAELTRETRSLAGATEENSALTQRACVLASVIGQSQRDSGVFAERITASVQEAATTLKECASRADDMYALVTRQAEASSRCLDADHQVQEYLGAVAKSARRFKLLALHGAMEAARAGAQSGAPTAGRGARGEEFRVVALEVRRLAVDLAKATDDIARLLDASRRELQSVHAAATDGQRTIQAARGAFSLGVAAMEQATSTAATRRADDTALAEAGAELTILTSSIRERAAAAATGTGDVADRLATLDRLLASAARATHDIDQALAGVEATTVRARESVATIVNAGPGATPATSRHAKRGTARRARPMSRLAPKPGARR